MKHAAPGKIFFERANIKVTESRFSTGAEIFPIKKIIAVNVVTGRRNLRTGLPLAAGAVLTNMSQGSVTALGTWGVSTAEFCDVSSFCTESQF